MENFNFDISQEALHAITDMGYAEPTPIQTLTIPKLIEGKDVIGQAQTGTGKTAAFGIPMLEKVDVSERRVQALVLCPTRELAVQTAGELAKLSKYRPGLVALPVYGGQPIERQLRGLSAGAQIVVGTPGRVMDHMNRGSLSFEHVRFLVLDEADEMLDMGFRDDIEAILSKTNQERQTALFSATMPLPILNLARKYMREPEYLRVANKEMTVEAVRQSYVPIRAFHKVELLARLLVRDGVTRALVFMNTKIGVEDVVTQLQSRGFAAAGLHGDMRQIERDAIMARFKNGMIGILVATDVAARGLDVEGVEAVFNYDLPLDVEYYVHRVGRTGRAGKDGRAYTFVVGRETARMWEYRKYTKAAILCEQPPSGDDIRAAQEARVRDKAIMLAAGELSETALENAKRMLEDAEPARVLAALITMLETESGEKIKPEMDIRVPEPPPKLAPAIAPRRAPARPGFAPRGAAPRAYSADANTQRATAPRGRGFAPHASSSASAPEWKTRARREDADFKRPGDAHAYPARAPRDMADKPHTPGDRPKGKFAPPLKPRRAKGEVRRRDKE